LYTRSKIVLRLLSILCSKDPNRIGLSERYKGISPLVPYIRLGFSFPQNYFFLFFFFFLFFHSFSESGLLGFCFPLGYREEVFTELSYPCEVAIPNDIEDLGLLIFTPFSDFNFVIVIVTYKLVSLSFPKE